MEYFGIKGGGWMEDESATSCAMQYGRMGRLRDDDFLVDMVLAVDGELIPVHSLVAAANSDHLLGAIRSGSVGPTTQVKWRGRDVRRVDVTGVPADGVRRLVNFWYTGELGLRPNEAGLQDVKDVMAAADYLLAWKGVALNCALYVATQRDVDIYTRLKFLLDMGEAYDLEKFKTAAVDMAIEEYELMTTNPRWPLVPLDIALEVVAVRYPFAKEDDEDFMSLFERVLKWAEGKSTVESTADLEQLLEAMEMTLGTALNFAVENSRVDLVIHLLALGAPATYTALIMAAQRGSIEVVNALLQAGADPNPTLENVETPLHRAALRSSLPVVSALLAAGANPNATNNTGTTPLMMSTDADSIEVVRALLAAGADVNRVDEKGDNALTNGIQSINILVLRELLQAGVDVNHPNGFGDTALMIGIDRRVPVEVVRELLQAGANVNHANRRGDTALMIGINRRVPVEVVRELLQAGANVNHANRHGKTALMRAARINNDALLVAVTDALLDAGADPEQRDNSGHRALWHFDDRDATNIDVPVPQLRALFSGPRRGTRRSPRKRARDE